MDDFFMLNSKMLKVKNLGFSYTNTKVLNNISLEVKTGENLAIIGESGSGKSTLLKAIYGSFDLPQGTVYWKDTQILGPAHNLVIGYDFMKYVAQEFDLMPFITVSENIGKYLSNFFPEEKSQRTAEILEIIELEDFAKVKVKNLSGGQKQRVALGRAIAAKPEILLLDEPFSHIDNFKKRSLRRNLFGYLKKENISCIVATHDKDDVLGFSDNILVLEKGVIIDQGTPQKMYRSPKTSKIASFFEQHNVIIQSDLLDDENDKHLIVYASQLEVVENSKFKVKVTNSYFRGNLFLVESLHLHNKIYFTHPYSIEEGTIVSLQLIPEHNLNKHLISP